MVGLDSYMYIRPYWKAIVRRKHGWFGGREGLITEQ